MSLELCLYLIDVLGNLRVALLMVALLGIVVIIFIYIEMYDVYGEEINKYSLGWIKKLVIISLASFSFCVLIPSPKTMYMIAGTNYLKQSDIPQKVRQLLDKKLEELLIIG